MNLTQREVHWRLDAIGKRHNEDIRFQAKLHQMEIKGSNNSEAPKLTEAQESALEARIKGLTNG